MVNRFPDLVLTNLPFRIQTYVIDKRTDLKEKIDYVDLGIQNVYSHGNYIFRVMAQPYRNSQEF